MVDLAWDVGILMHAVYDDTAAGVIESVTEDELDHVQNMYLEWA